MGEIPLISVIVPVYNQEKYIRRCIESIDRQDYPNLEIIVVDDGSTDKTAKLARKAGAKVICQKNAGPAKARNVGAKNAKGKISPKPKGRNFKIKLLAR